MLVASTLAGKLDEKKQTEKLECDDDDYCYELSYPIG